MDVVHQQTLAVIGPQSIFLLYDALCHTWDCIRICLATLCQTSHSLAVLRCTLKQAWENHVNMQRRILTLNVLCLLLGLLFAACMVVSLETFWITCKRQQEQSDSDSVPCLRWTSCVFHISKLCCKQTKKDMGASNRPFYYQITPWIL